MNELLRICRGLLAVHLSVQGTDLGSLPWHLGTWLGHRWSAGPPPSVYHGSFWKMKAIIWCSVPELRCCFWRL